MLRRPKEKGRRLELQIAEILREYGYKDAHRQPLSGGIDFLKGDINSKQFPFFVEVKNCETWHPLEWYRKSASETIAKPPVIVMSKNNEDIYAFLRFTDLLDIMKKGFVNKDKRMVNHKRLSLDETSNLKFSKKWSARRKQK